MKHLLILIPFLLIMSGCEVKVVSSNPRQVTVNGLHNFTGTEHIEAQALADKECKKHGRYAIHRPDNLRDGNATYECVK